MKVRYIHPVIAVEAGSRTVRVRVRIENRGATVLRPSEGHAVGSQVVDPETGVFLAEGEWKPLPCDLAPGESAEVELPVALPAERGFYRISISLVHPETGWAFRQGNPFLVVDARVEDGRVSLVRSAITTERGLRARLLLRSLRRGLTLPFASIIENRSLIRSMARRDILARYRGSFGGALWTILNPLLLMATYFYVFGILLHARFSNDPSRWGFALYFLAGMLPWLAFSEAAGRAPYVILEYRNFVKKLVFPVETLPVTQAIAGLVTEAFALLIFLAGLLAVHGSIPATVVWLPVLLIPQFLFTLGAGWFLAALGAYVKDLGQVNGFLLTLWFFLTPICYPAATIHHYESILRKNPIYVLVAGYRAIFLEQRAPDFSPLWKLWLVAVAVFLLGHAWFYKLRKTFPDVV